VNNFNTPAAIVLASIIIPITILYRSTKDPITNFMKLVIDNYSSSVRT